MSCVDKLQDCLTNAEAAGCEVVKVDLAALEFMDSTSLNALIQAWQRAKAGGWKLRILNPVGAVMRVFEVTGLTYLVDQSR